MENCKFFLILHYILNFKSDYSFLCTRAKYLLAIVRKLLDIIGLDVCLGYDIGCAFAAMLKKISLANDVKAQNLHSLCGVFHGEYRRDYTAKRHRGGNLVI